MSIRQLSAVILVLALATAATLRADVKTQERTQVKFEGALGRIVNIFGGRAARDGIVSTVAVKGDRMMTTSRDTGEIVDLAEEQIYTLDLKKKTYTVVTFAEMRKRMEEAMAKAKKDVEARKDDQKSDEPQKEYEVDFSVKQTGRTRQIAGYDTQESIATVTVREKGKTVEEGGMVMETSLWMTPSVPALKELGDFRLRYAEKLYGPLMAQAAPDMAQAMAMYPMMKDAMAKFQEEGRKLSGTALATESKFQLAGPPQGTEEQARADEPAPTGVGGLLGGLGRRMARKKEEKKDDTGATPGRATVMTTITESLQVSSTVTDAEVAIPAGFKQR